MKKIIEVKNLTKSYKKFKAVENLSFDVNEGEIIGLWGQMVVVKPQPLIVCYLY